MVIAIIAVLIALLLPAVQSARRGRPAGPMRQQLEATWARVIKLRKRYGVYPYGMARENTGPNNIFSPNGYYVGSSLVRPDAAFPRAAGSGERL